MAISEEQAARKRVSELRLAMEEVRINPHLPAIEAEAETIRRAPQAVADRLLALTLVAGKGEGIDDIVRQVIEEKDARRCFSPAELAFIDDPAPSDHDRTQFLWRFEAAWVMFWALGWPEEPLGVPREICDVPYLAAMVGNVELAVNGLRPQAEILDEADFIYRCHWAARQADLDGETPSGGLDTGVTMERHHALNWLIGYGDDAAWDDVTTDT